MNSVTLIGRLVKDPEIGYTTTQTAVCRFTLTVDRTGEGADFINCKCFKAQAENLHKWKRKGEQIAIQGRINTGDYTDKQGKKVYFTEVIADRVEFIGNRERQEKTPRNPETTYEDFSAVNDYVPF